MRPADAEDTLAFALPLLGALALAFGSPWSARAGEAVMLKPALVVEGPVVTLGDLFAPAGEAGATPLLGAPEPGASLTLDPIWLQQAAARAGLEWANPADLRSVSLSRASAPASAAQIAQALAEALAKERGGRWVVTLADSRDRHAPAGSRVRIEVAQAALDAAGQLTGLVRLAPGLPEMSVLARAEPAIELAAPLRPIARGETIAAADLDWITLPQSRAPANAITGFEALIGLAAKRALRAGEPVRAYDVVRPPAIRKGEIAQVTFERGLLRLTARARALGDVAPGESGRFVNLGSSRIIEAVAVRPGLARASGGGLSEAGGAP